MESHRASPEALSRLVELLRGLYDYTVIDAARSLDDITIHLFDEADVVYVVLTADLSCLKNVQVVLKTMGELGYPRDKVQLVLNRSNAFTGINIANAESVLGRPIAHKVINEYRGAIGLSTRAHRSWSAARTARSPRRSATSRPRRTGSFRSSRPV